MSDYREREKSISIGTIEQEPVSGTRLEPGAGVDAGEERGEAELLTINLGPHHPATHGVLRLLCTLEGETVRTIDPIIGYVHTGIEKSCEDQEYWKAITFVERMDYLSYYFNAYAYCSAVETLLDEEVPPRAQYLRVIHMELNRIASHLFWLGTGALDIGAITMLWWALRERDLILDLFEMSSGQRFHTRYFQVGGVMEDIPPGFEGKVREFLSQMPSRVDQYEALLDRNEIWLQRTQNTGIVPLEQLLGLGVTGPLLRAAGKPWDLRKAM
ncbi:MAG: NADH-quinone oxidoreductase subunit D, partial [Thermoleophilaceae bacterium]